MALSRTKFVDFDCWFLQIKTEFKRVAKKTFSMHHVQPEITY